MSKRPYRHLPNNYRPLEPTSQVTEAVREVFGDFRKLAGRFDYRLLLFTAVVYLGINGASCLQTMKRMCNGYSMEQIEAVYKDNIHNDFLCRHVLDMTDLGRKAAVMLKDEGVDICDYLRD